MAANANYGLDSNRMGVVVYGNDAQMAIYLNQYATVAEFAVAVGDIGYLDQSTNTASGIRVLREQLFTETSGITHIAIVTPNCVSPPTFWHDFESSPHTVTPNCAAPPTF